MKLKTTIPFFILSIIVLTSCKKDYACECRADNKTIVTYQFKAKKAEALDKCYAHEAEIKSTEEVKCLLK